MSDLASPPGRRDRESPLHERLDPRVGTLIGESAKESVARQDADHGALRIQDRKVDLRSTEKAFKTTSWRPAVARAVPARGFEDLSNGFPASVQCAPSRSARRANVLTTSEEQMGRRYGFRETKTRPGA